MRNFDGNQIMKSLVLAVLLSMSFSLFATSKRPDTVLLICHDSHVQAWQTFANWKTSIGKSTKIISTKTIAEKYNGKDIQEKIRLCCVDHIKNNGTKWVILGGDSQPGGKGLVPDRDTAHRNMFAKYNDIPTDVYYLSEKNWDANGDGIYGVWGQDNANISYINTKATIGRIPIRTVADIKAYTDKIIAYESKYPEKNFASNMVYTCPERGAYNKLHTSKNELGESWKGGQLMQYFGNKTPWDKKRAGDHELLPNNWVSLINNKSTGKMHIHGHGFLPVWVLEKKQTVNARHVNQLKNENAYLTMTTVSCFTGQYDSVKDPSITESMLRKPKGGAVIILAPSREGVPVFHNPRIDFGLMAQGKMDGTTGTLTNFWRHALSEDLTAGEAMRAAKIDMLDDAKKSANYHYIQCEINLLGDPTLDLRARNPKTPKIVAAKSIKKGKQKLLIKTDTAHATVCLWDGKDLYHTAKTDSKGQLSLSINPSKAGTINLTVSGPSLNVSSHKITVN